jgi:acetolactate synthase I/II/III large subunit
MNGAESLVRTLVAGGVEVCFANPGTSEMHCVAALDEVEGMRGILGLFEGVVSGAADGYARMARKPAATLLHLGPGFSNAMANIHNARKGHIGMVNIVGDQATSHLEYDAPLASDIEGMAATVSHWVKTSRSPEYIAADTAQAVQAAAHDQIATLILPADVSWGETPSGAAAALDLAAPPRVGSEKIEQAAAMLRSGEPTLILAGGREIGVELGLMLGQIGKACGARVCAETFPTRIARGAGTARLDRLPYAAESAIETLRPFRNLLLIGAPAPVSFFAYPGLPSRIPADDCRVLALAQPGHDIDRCVQELLLHVGAAEVPAPVHSLEPPGLPAGELTAECMARAIANLLPQGAIIVDDGATTTPPLYAATAAAAPHDWLTLTGGSIGFGLPCAVGAAVAEPARKVVCVAGDGSAMYTIQALWTIAREQLDITVVVCNNRKYNVLAAEFSRTGARDGAPGPRARTMLEIGSPDMDFVAMANGMGVSASRADSAEQFNEQFAEAMATPGPRLIDAMVPAL